MNTKRNRFQIIKWLGAAGLLILILPKIYLRQYSKEFVSTEDNLPESQAAIVFGAGLWRDGSPTPVLMDRIETAADLYFRGKVEKLLMSGDNRTIDYNEPAAMKNYAMLLGVPEEDIILDYAGRRTYDTCYRARDIFQVDRPVLVTQAFHLSRAIFLCHKLGLDASGVPAENRTYRRSTLANWEMREFFASFKAVWDIFILRPVPVLGNPEPIFNEPSNDTINQ